MKNSIPHISKRLRLLRSSMLGATSILMGMLSSAALAQYASVPFSEGFETGTLQSYWQTSGTGSYRTQVTSAHSPHSASYHATMDCTSGGEGYARNELTLGVDLGGESNLELVFWAKDFDDEPDGPPATPFSGGADFDGVAISEDGVNWYEVQALRSELSDTYSEFKVDLDAAVATHGLTYNSTFRIRFNQYDNWPVPGDGIAIDDLSIAAPSVQINFFTASETTVESNNTVTLAWDVDSAISLTLDPGNLDVTGLVSTNVVIMEDMVYTLTASDGVESVTNTVYITTYSPTLPGSGTVLWRRDWEQLAHDTTITGANLDGGPVSAVEVGTQDVEVISGSMRVFDSAGVGGFDLISTLVNDPFEATIELTDVQYAADTRHVLEFVIGSGASSARTGAWFVEFGTIAGGVFHALPAVDAGSAAYGFATTLGTLENFQDNANPSALFGYHVGGRLQQLIVDATDAQNGQNVAIRFGVTTSLSWSGFSDMALVAQDTTLPVILAFDAGATTVASNDTVTLSWATAGAEAVSLEPGGGDVTGRSSTNVVVTEDVTYALIASNASGSVTSTVAIAVNPPLVLDPYALYRADMGVTLDESGKITRWETQTTTAHDLDRVTSSPTTLTLARSGGGSATVVDLDGHSGLWAAVADFESLLGDRTVVARARLKGSGDGFLFDGTTSSSGLTRAQVRSGMWQAGVQAGSGFANPDPDTTAITPRVWQTHVFQYDEIAGSTEVTHWIDGAQVGEHTVSVDVALKGIIVGVNGAQDMGLEAELAEIQVFDRLLTPAERAQAETDLTNRWGDLVDLPFTHQSSTVVQTSDIISKVGIHGIAALELTSQGNLPGDVVTNLTFNLNGTTDPADIGELQLYTSGSAIFSTDSATLLATAPPVAGSFSTSIPITSARQYLWLAASLLGTSDDDDRLDAEITEFKVDGPSVGTHVPTVTAPPEFLTIRANAFYSVVIRKKGDDGINTYRIPGLATTTEGTLIAVFDNRNNGSGDLPGNIDVGLRRSTDGGFTWEPLQTIMDYDASIPGSSGNGVGDPSVLVDLANGRIWCAALWSFGDNAWNGSGPGMTTNETGQFVLNYSDDDGVTWSDPVSIIPQIKDPAWNLYYNGPGKGICTRDGILIFPSQYRDGGGTPRSNFIYSEDRGATWHHGPPAIASGSPWTTESQIVELNNGDLLISMRNHAGISQRMWCIYSWDHGTESIADGSWGAPWHNQTDPTVMASVERYRSTLDGHPWSGLLFSNPDHTSRSKMSIRLSLDEGVTWPYKRKIDDRPAGYSCLTLLPDGDIGLLYETGSSTYETLTFVRFPLEWIVGTNDTDLDRIPDFHEDVLGLDKGHPDDADEDPDGDGANSRDEYWAQTLPFSSNSVLRVTSVETTGGNVRVGWPSVPYVVYDLENGTDPALGDWTPVPGAASIMATSTNLSAETPVGAPDHGGVYRVAVP